ncbi:hypothetical protein N7481_001675 [Penicillium waksmanii]|uniref:uncharacterized protein n=1 Tax=Penicillium waksmanii TaxID=69791 RepID=UPI002548C347|nr:uncharacterized protein N7481_001675 [Penicillium waksmanii]KAJ5994698.1 hypothetical protein N7481_001675 [Penicillium waksmanii]
MSDSNTDGEALSQLQVEQGWLLDKIDELRNIGISGLVDLPQLIVCGNQSSGKSSVLEAISRVRFPVKSNICTRFATEVSLRRHPVTRFKVSIEPGPSRKSEVDRQKVREFAPEAFTHSDQLPLLIEQAKDCMGIQNEKGVSDDVLKIEISGPDKPELTLVDLPGLYYSKSAEQGAEGIVISRELTEQYMKSPRSIILATVSAKADYHLQEVLDIAAKFDPSRDRTIGIITHPDKLEQHSEEEDVWLQIAKNEKIRLRLGWHTLQNRTFGTQEVSSEDRDKNEKEFFNQGRWSTVARDCVGIDGLRRRLSGILLKHIRRSLPELIAEIEKKLLNRHTRLTKMGAPRSTLQQQKGYLLALSSNFERITNQALDGMYKDVFFGELGDFNLFATAETRRLRATVRQLNEYFAEVMEVYGCKTRIIGVNEGNIALFSSNPYAHIRTPPTKARQDVEKELDRQARQSRGLELPGSANQLLVGSLFRDQSQPWEEIARFHFVRTWEAVDNFVNMVLQHLTDEHTYQQLMGAILAPELQKMKESLLTKLDELTAYNKRGHPLPLGKRFLQRIHKSRADRQGKALEKALGQKIPVNDGRFALPDIKAAMSKLENKTEDQFAAAEIIDQMQAYYDTAIISFIDNIAILGIENCLLCPLSGIFTSQTINNMEDKQVKDLAAEESFITEDRERLIREKEMLQNSLNVLAHCKIQRMPTNKPLIDQPEPPNSAGTPGQNFTVQRSKKSPASHRSNIFAHAHTSNSTGRSGGGPFGNANNTDGSTTNRAGFFGSPLRAPPDGNSTLNPGISFSGGQQNPLPTGSLFMRSGESVDTGLRAVDTQNGGLFGGYTNI